MVPSWAGTCSSWLALSMTDSCGENYWTRHYSRRDQKAKRVLIGTGYLPCLRFSSFDLNRIWLWQGLLLCVFSHSLTNISQLEWHLIKQNLLLASPKVVSVYLDLSTQYSFFSLHTLNPEGYDHNASCRLSNPIPCPVNISSFRCHAIYYNARNWLFMQSETVARLPDCIASSLTLD
jgi:hypothetical protein